MLSTYKEKMTYYKDSILAFRGEYYYLSNFSDFPILYRGQLWPTSEHLFQGLKTLIPSFRETIRLARTPSEAKKYGRYRMVNVEGVQYKMLRPDWDEVKIEVMKHVIDLKFNQHKDIANKLMATNEKILIEGNTWCDNFWGICNCKKCTDKTIPRLNMLGIILMTKRQMLKDSQ